MPKLPGVNLITFARPEIQTKATVWVMLICKFNNLKRWYEEISQRSAVIKGYDVLNAGDKIPKI